MKLLQSLIEAKKDPYLAHPHDAQEFIVDLQRDCKEFIAAYRKSSRVLYRGTSEQKMADEPFVSGFIRQDRKPIFMNAKSHTLISDAMEKMSLASRRNSLFCTADRNTASEWGTTYIIFVNDGWKGTVFTKIKKDDYAFNKLQDEAGNIRDAYIEYEEQQKEMIGVIERLGAKSFKGVTDLVNIIKDQYLDILITGAKFYGVRYGSDECEALLDTLEIY